MYRLNYGRYYRCALFRHLRLRLRNNQLGIRLPPLRWRPCSVIRPLRPANFRVIIAGRLAESRESTRTSANDALDKGGFTHLVGKPYSIVGSHLADVRGNLFASALEPFLGELLGRTNPSISGPAARCGPRFPAKHRPFNNRKLRGRT